MPKLECDSPDAAYINDELNAIYAADFREFENSEEAGQPGGEYPQIGVGWDAYWYGDCVSLVVRSRYGGTAPWRYSGWCFDFATGRQITTAEMLQCMELDPDEVQAQVQRQAMQAFDREMAQGAYYEGLRSGGELSQMRMDTLEYNELENLCLLLPQQDRLVLRGGCSSTACTLSDEVFGVPAGGTMAHSWVQMFDSELDAFRTYCEIYPHNATLLIDTYNVLDSGLPHAIAAFDEVLRPRGITSCAIRIDSGDITYLTQKIRARLDEAGWQTCKIVVSNSMDEYIIRELIRQGACIDAFGVGERLITAKSDPVFGGVYKLCAVEAPDGTIIPKIKISENVSKITTPHFKKVYRLRGRDTGKAEADLICLHDETVDDSQPLEIFDPQNTWKRKVLTDFTAEELLVPVFRGGELVYSLPTLPEIRARFEAECDGMWEEVRRFTNPHNYYVDLSQKLWDIKQVMLNSRTH